jgi:2-desacetyl-2-hydroxyethyl bacteriochlorophyllide A dehydrogenase
MRAVRCADGEVQVVDLPEPRGDGVRVKLRSAGICGSDLHLLDSPFAPRVTLGHEMAGELADGSAVAVEPLVICGECDCCLRGDYNLCRGGPGSLMGVGLDGGMTETIVVPERCLVALPKGVGVRDACLVEPMAVAVHGVRIGGIGPGDVVAVIGGGTIGLCSVVAARAAGAAVTLHARHDAQREAGARLGAQEGGDEYDVVIESAGTESALASAVEMARPGGRLVLVATYWQGMALPGIPLCLKELQIVTSSMYAREGDVRDFDRAAALVAQVSGLAEILITHRFPLDEAVLAFATARDRAQGAIKVVLEA